MKRWIPFIISLFLLTGCAEGTPEQVLPSATQEVFAMDTYMTVTAYGERAEEAVTASVEELNRLDALWSVGNPESEVSVLNENGSILLSEETAELVEESLSLYESTGGRFDLTIYPLMEEWGFTSGEYKIPSPEQMQALLPLVNASALDYDSESRQLTLPESVKVDLGGIAKGYTSARLMKLFEEYGVESGMVSLGGNIQLLGTKPDGTDWRVAVENPDPTLFPAEYLGVIQTADKAVITSGGYERYFEKDGVRYHHILDPSTGYPADSGLVSVTIVSKSGILADGLSTALFIMGKEQAVDYWQSHRTEFDAVLAESDGRITVTAGLKDVFSSNLAYEIAE